MRRMNEYDVENVEAAMGHLDLAFESLRQIDLRSYVGDEEVLTAVRGARDCVKDARKRLRAAKNLRWRR